MVRRKPYLKLFVFLLIIGVFILSLYFIISSKSSISQTTEKNITLLKNTPYTTSSQIILTITTLNLSSENCIDCKSTVVVTATKEKTTQLLTFKVGGIQGERQLKQTAFGFDFTLIDLKEDRITLEVSSPIPLCFEIAKKLCIFQSSVGRRYTFVF